ncbi:MAG: hypothetical protein HGA47_04695, partial [Zoogloea sp.]|nr:hypothetical protein [Zoogloea sp.]
VCSSDLLRPANVLPLLPPMALLAAGGVGSLRRGATNAFDWFALTCFTFFALVVWMGWSALNFGWPPGLGRQLAKLAGGVHHDPEPLPAIIAGVLCLGWLLLPRFTVRGPYRATTHWAFGTTMLWCLAVLLWQPWFERTRSYAEFSQAFRTELEKQPEGCVANQGLNPSQLAALDYHAGVKLQAWPQDSHTACKLVLVYSDGRVTRPKVSDTWHKAWEYRRGGGRLLEVFQLYRRD